MARRGPRLIDSHLDFAAGRLDYVVERPAEEGLPEVIRILDDTDTQRISEGECGEYFFSLSLSTSSGEAQDTDTQRISEREYGEYFSPLSPSPSFHEAPYADDGEQEGEYPPYLPVDDEEVSEPTDNSSDWNDSEEWGDWLSDDSGYDTMDERDDSPLIREHPPEPFWHDWQPPIAPGAAPIGQANAPLFPQVVVPVGDPPAAPPSAASSAAPSSAASSAAPSSAASSAAPSSAASSAAPSSSASSAAPSSSASSSAPSAAPSSGKRSREDLCPEEVSAKRCKVSDTFDAPSTSSGSFGVRRFWERPFDFSLDDSDSD
ncbi:uncharacterized protein YMR317W-like [Oreochromis niloticus]|uniref:uncharacterized protein YMR317W-like n=1 Tax=Oreochromis niloticus TaxID=8128 RepID=UPI000DF21218|nr:uncharacterized protein YMR317W-like [Oreochromis niloticus]